MDYGMGVWLGVLGMALALAMDAFAVSIATGIKLVAPRPWQTLRIAACFGFFQFFMPVVGWLTGRELAQWFQAWDHWIALGLLAAVGSKMIYDALSGGETSESTPKDADSPCAAKKASPADPSRGLTLMMLGLATSIDAFAVGVSMAMLQRPIWIPCIIFGLVAATLSVIGMRYGARIGRRIGSEAEIVGGVVLILIGLVTLISHLADG